MKINIRKATLKDISKIDEIYLKGCLDEVKTQFKNKKNKVLNDFRKYEKDRIKGFKKAINSSKNYLIVAEKNKKIIGFGEATINSKEQSEIGKVYVLKEERKNTIGSKIMNILINWLKKNKVKYISVGIFINNTPSIKLCKKFGFKETAIRMQKELK